MISLLAPAWLAAAAAVLIPIVIHLLGRGRGRTVKVGSIRWLRDGRAVRGRRLHPRRPWLLLLRCLLLAAVAGALAEPRAAGPLLPDDGVWLLVAPELLEAREMWEPGNRELYEALDRAWPAAAERRLLAPGLPRPGSGGADASTHHWSVLRQADLVAPPGRAFEIYTPARSVGFRGVRPILDRAVTWRLARGQGANRWIDSAAEKPDGIEVVIGESDAELTRFLRRQAEPAPGRDGVSAARTAAGVRLRLADGGAEPGDDDLLLVERPPLSVEVVYVPDRAADVAYLRAALGAVEEVGGFAITLREVPLTAAAELFDEAADLAFHLASSPPPEEALERLATRGGTLMSDAGERYETVATMVESSSGLEVAAVRFDRLASPAPDRAAAVPLWRGVAGEVILEGERIGDGLWLRFRGRFDPAWTELVHTPAFALWIAELVRRSSPAAPPPSAVTERSDRRELAPADVLPERRPQPGPRRWPYRWPERSLWWLVACLLPFERLLASGARR